MARRGFTCCWACDFEWAAATPRRVAAAHVYEMVIEQIERWPGSFTLARVWELVIRNRAGSPAGPYYDTPALYVIARHVVADLAEHGLIECLRRSGGVRQRCLEWRVKTT